MAKLTKRRVDAIKPADHDVLLWDDKLRGFGVLVKPSGVRSDMVQHRNAQGRSRCLTISQHDVLSPDQARKEARQLLARVDRGVDPTAERERVRRAPTVAALCDRYLADHVKFFNKPRTAKDVRRIVEKHIKPAFRGLKTEALNRGDVTRLHRSMETTPRRVNCTLIVSRGVV